MGTAVSTPMWVLEDGRIVSYQHHPCVDCKSCIHRAMESDAVEAQGADTWDEDDDWDDEDDEDTDPEWAQADLRCVSVIEGEEPWSACISCGHPIQAGDMTMMVNVWVENDEGDLVSQIRHIHNSCVSLAVYDDILDVEVEKREQQAKAKKAQRRRKRR